ncbi:hypothetical protein D3C77_701000 [compost metagenome]
MSGLSTSVAVRVPPVTSGASVSVRVTLALLTTAASLLPVMVTVTLDGVPSTLVTAKLSLSWSPTFSALNALLAVKVHWPSAARVNAPY